MTKYAKLIVGILSTLFVTAIVSSAKAIVDVEVLKSENTSVKILLINAQTERRIIQEDIKDILKKMR